MQLQRLDDYPLLFEKKVKNIKKIGKVGLMTLGGAAVLGPLGFAASGAVGAGFLGLELAGTSIMTATGATLGGALGGVIANGYFGNIEGFSIVNIKNGTGPPVICIDGFLTEKKDRINVWKRQLKPFYPTQPWYLLNWESKRLHDLGIYLAGGGSKAALQFALKRAAGKTAGMAVSRLTAFGLVIDAMGLLANPWHTTLARAGQTGVLLADILARVRNQQFILIGHSLGARVIYYALQTLGTAWTGDHTKVIKTHLLGGAVQKKNTEKWALCAQAVEQGIYNYYSKNDRVLKYLYRTGNLFLSPPIGLNPIPSKEIISIDVSGIVTGHFKFREYFSEYVIENRPF